MRWLLLLLTFLTIGGQTVIAADEMPIIAYMGVPNNLSTDQNFKDFSDCGFNVSLYGYASLQEMTAACDIAQKYGVRILGHCPETHDTPERAAAVLRNHKGFFGYVLQDEPSADDIKVRQKEIARIRRVDDNHCFYINLHPYYADWTLIHTKTDTYEEYLDAATATSCRQLSFDYYPITHDGLRDGWYRNLELIRQQSLKAKIPFWGFVLSVPHAVYPQPTLGGLRLQVYSNLAYGAQAIQYFTYWTPKPDGENDYHNGPVDNSGHKTNTYTLVQQMNRELATVAKLFYGAKVTSVRHLGRIDIGTKRQTAMPVNISALKVIGNQGAVISLFEKDAHRYLAIVNKDYEKSATIRIRTRNDLPRRMTKDLHEERVKQTYTVSAGDILIFKLN